MYDPVFTAALKTSFDFITKVRASFIEACITTIRSQQEFGIAEACGRFPTPDHIPFIQHYARGWPASCSRTFFRQF
jgi:hypothetical protein